jgi:hypothetical protein
MISLPLPGLSRILNQAALKLSAMDIIPTDLVFEYTKIDFNDFNDRPFNTYFDQAGLSSLQALKNLGSTYLFIVTNIFAAIFIIFAKISGLIYKK